MLTKDIIIYNIMPYLYIYQNNIIEKLYKKEFMNIIIEIDSWTKIKYSCTCFITNDNKYSIRIERSKKYSKSWCDSEMEHWKPISNHLSDIMMDDLPDNKEVLIDNVCIRYMYGKSKIEINIDQIKFSKMIEMINDVIDSYNKSKFAFKIVEYL